jgi:hypothetical protein
MKRLKLHLPVGTSRALAKMRAIALPGLARKRLGRSGLLCRRAFEKGWLRLVSRKLTAGMARLEREGQLSRTIPWRLRR